MRTHPLAAFRGWLSRTPPPAVLAVLYLSLILAGGLALMLPFTTTRAISFSDAIFTSTSAVTVTGLSVIDTELDLTFWGQVVVAVLIQLGGLGLMTFAVLVWSALGLPLRITHHTYLREDLNQTSYVRLTQLVFTIFRVALMAEIAGAMLLSLSFMPREGLGPGLWDAVFHSVSAFNNAGFSTFSEGLVRYATDPLVNIVIPGLFILGGIGYVVVSDVWNRRFWYGWTLHTRLMLVGTAALIVIGVGLTAILEWNNPLTLAQYDGPVARMTVAWFQGVTPRTAGFNTVDIGGLHDSTSLLYMALMIIGAGPTSTGGGLKVTTIVVMLLATLAFFRRRTEIWAFGRSIGLDEVLKVMALIAIASVLIFTAVFLMMASHDGYFLDISFEVASAFGTTGLSRGYTSELNPFGRIIIITVMFLGRVGPLTLGFFLATRTTPRVRYPEGQVHLG
ncbi:MAG: TrkH family potassium uptake protein [Paracoccus sp. (in: a-proteobacteria)]|uniref:TrkH family potassium uptake protein n=1 Tax=unclassified Paracoccus (in: a-proteobacteria) TaxID=2688777 RepID=UPI0025D38D27|nr:MULTISPECIES: potassium transporter TrkG [unclassified Paracoccus (in: a-proteobacteria)]